MSAFALPAHRQQNLMLSAAPVRSRIDMKNFHRRLAYTIAAFRATPRGGVSQDKLPLL